jgi:hypothetical protein
MTRGCRNLNNEVLHNLYSLPVRMIKAEESGRVCSTKRRTGMHKGCWWEIQNERDHKKDQDIGEWVILRWIFERWGGVESIGLISSR